MHTACTLTSHSVELILFVTFAYELSVLKIVAETVGKDHNYSPDKHNGFNKTSTPNMCSTYGRRKAFCELL